MANIALLVPREEMIRQAHNILQDTRFELAQMRVIATENAVVEARRAIADGASIIIARGLQASLIKQYTSIPVVEITLTAQEMALLIMRAKQIVKKPMPVIAVVGFRNMFCDMSHFDELYNIDLRTYFVKEETDLERAVQQAAEDQADLVMGGDVAVSAATKRKLPSLFLSMTEDSMRQAFAMAGSIEFAMNAERKTAAQMETLLDYTFNGVLRLDADGVITAVNPLMEDMLGERQETLRGRPLRTVLPQVPEKALEQAMKEGREYSMFLEIRGAQIFAVLAPVFYESRVDSAILTCSKMRKKSVTAEGKRKENSHGLPPLVRFDDILQKSKAMQECIYMAKLYALSEHPVVLMGEPGTEKRMLAQCIHNSGSRERGPFLDVPCEGLSEEEQRNTLFGEHGAALQAQGGTLLIRDVDELTAANQYRLYQLIRFHVCHGADIASLRRVDVRVMVTVGRPLRELMLEHRISQDLYYLLSGLELSVPPFRERKEDLNQKIDDTLRECCERYSRYHVLTNGARKILMNYPWYGNLFQIESFCERLILTAGKRSIDEVAVNRLLELLYPEETRSGLPENASKTVRSVMAGADAGPAKDRLPETDRTGQGYCEQMEPESAAEIRHALQKVHGNRGRAAAELGISKATLWRRMKKYGIQ